MNNFKCANICELLVDYVDGELPESEAELVSAHIASCTACRNELDALSQSLELARGEWSEIPISGVDVIARGRRNMYTGAALRALAGSALLAACCGGWWFFGRPLQPRVAVAPAERIEISESELAAIEANINQEASAARLIASANVLAGQPGAEEHAARSLRFVAEVYPQTQAGLEAARRLAKSGSDNSPTLPN
jgi:anti-sigma factor RsiW